MRTSEQAAEAAALADGVVVGSRAVEIADEGGAEALRDCVTSLRTALDGLSADYSVYSGQKGAVGS